MDRPDWRTDGRDWPNRAASRFVVAGGLTWHVQQAGAGPSLLLLHGTGASTHSWAGLLPLLAAHYTVIAPDLPGHGFTDLPRAEALSLPGMARAVAALLSTLDVTPAVVAGHSAGAAILIRMALDGAIAPHVLFSLNGALLPLAGLPMHLFAPLTRWIGGNPLIPRLFAFHAADRNVVDRLLARTGSAVPAESAALYARLARRASHAAGALGMMGHWDLAPIKTDLPRLATPLVMINGANDGLIPPAEARAVLALLPTAELIDLPGLGHLAHEEEPDRIAGLIVSQAGLHRVPT